MLLSPGLVSPIATPRYQIIHSQFVRSDQLDKYVKYNMIPSFYTKHTFFFGDSRVANRGPEQASYLSPMRDAIDRGLQPTNHTDFNVVPIDHMMVIETATRRRMRKWRRTRPGPTDHSL